MKPRDEPFDCRRVEDLLEAYVDGDLEPFEGRLVEAHLAGCATCREELALSRQVRQELRTLPHFDLPAADLVAIRRRTVGFGGNPGAPQGSWLGWLRGSWSGWGGWATAGATAALTVALVLAWLWREPAVEPPTTTPVSQAEIREAEAQARLALAYLARASRRAGEELRDDVLAQRVLAPTQRQLRQTLGGVLNGDPRPGDASSESAPKPPSGTDLQER
jgi:anti-sigma factor RsiW